MWRRRARKAPDAAYICRSQPEPEGGFTVTCRNLPPVVTCGETFEEAQANAREVIARCLEVMLSEPGSR